MGKKEWYKVTPGPGNFVPQLGEDVRGGRKGRKILIKLCCIPHSLSFHLKST